MPFGEWVSGLVIFQLGFPYEPSEVLLKMIKFLESHPIPSSTHLKQIPEVQVRRKRLRTALDSAFLCVSDLGVTLTVTVCVYADLAQFFICPVIAIMDHIRS